MVGTTLSHYSIEAELGRGGMGIVYRARDTKLDRTVAIKVLPSAALASDDDRARFYREAKAAAALTHPNIAIVHAVDEAVPGDAPHGTEPSPFIAMEFIDGETLHDRIKKGPLKLSEAVRIASEISDGLKAAHAKSIVHRDIKSANIMLDKEGRAKILDFGLALTAQSTKLTRMGSTLGTVAYMSPEQARGEVVDHRTDVWSVGAVLYEMIAGRSPFSGDYEQAVIYEILNQDPEPLTALRTGVPMSLERLADKCLAKSADRRYQSLSDFLVDIQSVAEDVTSFSQSQSRTTVGISTSGGSQVGAPGTNLQSSSTSQSVAVSVHRGRTPGRILAAGIAIGLIAASLIALFVPFGSDDSGASISGNVMHLELSLPEDLPMAFIGSAANQVGHRSLAISPDGSMLVYTAERNQTTQLVLHGMNTSSFDIIQGTEGAYVPRFSPNGDWITFAARGELKKVRADGGAPITIAPFTDADGFIWTDSGWIYFGDEQGSRLRRISENGGPVEDVSIAPNCCGMSGALPDTRYLFVRDWRKQGTSILDLDNGDLQALPINGASMTYLDTGHLLYSYRGRLFAVPFDKLNRTVKGGAIPLLDNLRTEPIAMRGQFDVSASGTLIYASGVAGDLARLVWLDSDGNEELIPQPEAGYGAVSVSDDGNRIAVIVQDVSGQGIQIIDLDTGIQKPLVRTGVNWSPAWSPSDNLVAYSAYVDGEFHILSKDPDGSAPADTLVSSSYIMQAPSFSPDGRWLSYYEHDAQSNSSIWVVSMEDYEDRQQVSAPNQNHWGSKFSRDGNFIAYTSLTSGRSEIRVEPFPPTGDITAVSSNGGEEPIWMPNGKDLVYRNGRQWMKVSFETDPTFTASTPEVVFEGPYINVGGFEYDVAPDGRFLLLRPLSDVDNTDKLHVVVNWFQELNRLAPIAE